MKRWAVITVTLYGLLLLALTIPAGIAFGIRYSTETKSWAASVSADEIVSGFSEWGYWLWFSILVGAQALMLLVPIDTSERRLPARRKLLVPAVTAAFLLANLFYAGLANVAVACFGDDGLAKPYELLESVFQAVPPAGAVLNAIGISAGSNAFSILTAIGILLAFWIIWALIFFHYAQSDGPDGITRRATRWLLRASILEILVAIPSHIIVRRRDDCCAPIATAWGIVTGLSVMLIAFGPGVYFLFVSRMRKKRPAANQGQEPPPPIGPEC